MRTTSFDLTKFKNAVELSECITNVSRSRTVTIRVDPTANQPTICMDMAVPNQSARTPETIAPTAHPKSRQKRYTPRADAHYSGSDRSDTAACKVRYTMAVTASKAPLKGPITNCKNPYLPGYTATRVHMEAKSRPTPISPFRPRHGPEFQFATPARTKRSLPQQGISPETPWMRALRYQRDPGILRHKKPRSLDSDPE